MTLLESMHSRLRGFLWDTQGGDGRITRSVRLVAQVVYLSVRDFFRDQCMLQASALTFTSLLSIVPLFALMFAVLKGFGVQNSVAPFLLERMAGGSQQVVETILEYINNTRVTRLGAFGLVSLLISVLTLMTNIERSFNHVWRVTETRSLMRRFSDYFSVLTIAPIFIFFAFSMSSSTESRIVIEKLVSLAFVGKLILILLNVLPFVVMWGVFVLIYLFIPNLKVRFSAALVGGMVGGSLWQLAQWGYLNFQVGVAKYNAIYGTMAALPIFMIWIYLSWMIVLFGLEINFVCQNLASIRQEMSGDELSIDDLELYSLMILAHLTRAYRKGEEAPQVDRIAAMIGLSSRPTRTLIDRLANLGLVVEVTSGEEGGYLPGRDPSSMKIHEILGRVRGVSNVDRRLGDSGFLAWWEEYHRDEERRGETVADLEARLG